MVSVKTSPLGAENAILPFRVEALDTRGRVVRLGHVLDTLLARHAYPLPVQRLLAEAITLTALMGAALKIDGSFQLQTRSDGAVDMLVVDFTPRGDEADIRAYARYDVSKIPAQSHASGRVDLLGKGHLAFTVEQFALQSRYQGIVSLEGEKGHGTEVTLASAALSYFRQSEQIPSALRIAVAEEQVQAPSGSTIRRWRAGGILAQFLPQAAERVRVMDLDPGDAPEGTIRHDVTEDDAWVEARARVESTQDIELVDPALGADDLLSRLFNEHDVRVSDAVQLHDQCRCSEPRIRETMAQFSAEDMADMVEPDGKISVTCEFCARNYRVSL